MSSRLLPQTQRISRGLGCLCRLLCLTARRFSLGCVAKTYPAFFEDLQKMRDHQAKGQAHNSCVLAVSADPSPSRALVAFGWPFC